MVDMSFTIYTSMAPTKSKYIQIYYCSENEKYKHVFCNAILHSV